MRCWQDFCNSNRRKDFRRSWPAPWRGDVRPAAGAPARFRHHGHSARHSRV